MLLRFIIQRKPVSQQELKRVSNAYFSEEGVFESKLGSNSYKKSGKIGFELNSWMNPGSLANTSSGAHFFCLRI